MVRIASSVIAVALAFSSFVSAAPAVVVKRQDITPIVPNGAEAGGEGGLDTIDLGGIPSDVDINGSLGNSVELPSSTEPIPPPPVETPPPPPPAQNPPPVNVPPPPPPPPSQPWPVYGSGGVVWHAGYGDCVQQCFLVHPQPPTVILLPSHEGQVVPPPGGEGQAPPPPPEAQGNGVQHDIVVEPVAGTLKFVPPFINANVGEAVRFSFANGAHSVVSSASILPCNATGKFDSGIQQPGGSFTFVVDSTDPQFFFSSVNNDCQAGMLGAINANTGSESSQTTVNALLPKLAEKNPDIAAAVSLTNSMAVNTGGLNWGGKIDLADVPEEFQERVAGSVLFTRSVMGVNPEMFDKEGVFRPQGELVVPNDISTLFAVADQGGYPAAPEQPAGEQPTGVAQNNLAAGQKTNGAGSIVSSRVAVAGVALLAAMLMF